MTQQIHVPEQEPGTGADGLPSAVPPVPPSASEATRLLCAGSYLDEPFRNRVIEELYVHEERFAAPALGFDAARVLAHALRARRAELGWSALILGLWLVGLILSEGLLLLVLLPGVILAGAARLRGEAARPPVYRTFPALVLRWWARIWLALMLIDVVGIAFGSGPALGTDPGALAQDLAPDAITELLAAGASAGAQPFHAWVCLVITILIAACLTGQRGQFARALTGELHPQHFPDLDADPAERYDSARFQRLRQRIRDEQHAPLVLYHAGRPFCGAGHAYDAWTLAVELRPDDAAETQKPVSNRLILEKIRPLLAQLRVPASHAVGRVRDRLRQLEIDECVFLPVAGLPRRDLAPYGQFAAHQADSVEEGGEARRHFLRIRVGGWEENIVTTVFVRVHTQGGMLMLEIAPHVLLPVREEFEDADRLAHQYRHNSAFGKAIWALARTPRSIGFAAVTLFRGAALTWRVLNGGYGAALADGPAVSVRELGQGDDASLFQDMDVRRYLKSVQDRVAHGVRQALTECGYRTDEFAQKVVNVSGGGVFIERAEGSAVTIGDHNVVSNTSGAQAAPDPFTKAQGGTDGNG
ncbi:hypothetical protein [Streptomyces sp. NPDC002851]